MIVAATGHRPEKLGGYDDKTRRALGALAVEWLHEARPSHLVVGMALGWDQAVAAACIALDIPFTAALPFAHQAQRWPAAAQARWRRLVDQAAEVVVVERPNAIAVPAMMQARNEWMVDRAERMLALWDGSWGGTFNCLEYAKRRGVPIENLWRRWSVPEEDRLLIG